MNIHALSGIRTSDPISKVAVNPRLGRRGHRHRPTALTAGPITTHRYARYSITSLTFYQTHVCQTLLPCFHITAICTYHETNESSHIIYLFIYLFIYLKCFHLRLDLSSELLSFVPFIKNTLK